MVKEDEVTLKIDSREIVAEIQKLGKEFDKTLKTLINNTNAQSKARLDQISAIEAKNERLARLDDRLKRGRRNMEVMSRASGVFGAGSPMGFAGNFLQSFAMMRMGDASNLKMLKESAKQKGLGTSSEDIAEMRRLESTGSGKSVFNKLENIFDRTFGEGSAFDKAFKGHGKEVATGLGLGAIGGGAMLGKMIIDSSPAFQQLLKIMNFGVMLILRPIGDFFAFLFRPILIMLLRKFIIPFYQHMYPFFMKYGTSIGEGISNIADFLSDTGGITKIFKASLISEGVQDALEKFFPKLKTDEKPVVDETPRATDDILPSGIKPTNIPAEQVIRSAVIPPAPKTAANLAEELVPNIAGKSIENTAIGKFMEGQKNTPLAKAAATKLSTIKNQVPKTTGVQWGDTLKNALKKGGVGTLKTLDTVMSLPATMAMKGTKLGYNVAKGLMPSGAVNKVINPLEKMITTKGSAVTAKLGLKGASRFIPVAGQILAGIDALGSTTKALAGEDVYNAIRSPVLEAGKFLGDKDSIYTEGLLDFIGWGKDTTAEQIVGLTNAISGFAGGGDILPQIPKGILKGRPKANYAGGVIREPIFGIGKSGQTYTFGEKGSEVVIPTGGLNGGGSTVINVTVNGSIMSERDMLNFQRTIMKAVETSNTRRARL